MAIKDKIKSKKLKLKNVNTSYINNTDIDVLGIAKVKLPLRQVFCSHSTLEIASQDNIDNNDNNDKETLM